MVPNTECVVAFWYRLSGEERETETEEYYTVKSEKRERLLVCIV